MIHLSSAEKICPAQDVPRTDPFPAGRPWFCGKIGVMTGPQQSRNRDAALRLEYATIAWNLGEAVLTIGLGVIAASLALIGFGADSVVEIFASVVVVWHLFPHREVEIPRRTALALRLVAAAFAGLAIVLAVLSIRDLISGRHPDHSPLGIAYLAITAVVMFGLAAAKRKLATALGSAPLRSEADMTFLDGILASATVLGLALYATMGWWWADPAAALVVAAAAANEARENWEEASDLLEGALAGGA